MKKVFSPAIAFIILAFMWQSCDKVKGPFKEEVVVQTGARKVLVEDYTGHKCGNCPAATKAIYDQKSIYGENLIILAIHAGSFAVPFPLVAQMYTYDFRTPEGDALDTDFGISNAGNPNGMVNRRQVNGSYILAPTEWDNEVYKVLTDPTPVPVKITIANDYNSSNRDLSSEVSLEFFTDISDPVKLCMFMVEDSMVNWQKDYFVTPNDIPDYMHREFLRGSMNSTYGETVTGTTAGSTVTVSHSFTLPAGWNDQQMSVLAFLFRESTKEIIQVEIAHIE